jgi:hypothetical protein
MRAGNPPRAPASRRRRRHRGPSSYERSGAAARRYTSVKVNRRVLLFAGPLLFAKITYSRDDHCNLGYVFPGVDGGDDGGDTRESGWAIAGAGRGPGGGRGGRGREGGDGLPRGEGEGAARGVANECAKERARRDIIIAVT